MVDSKKRLRYNRYIMKLQNFNQSAQHTLPAGMSAYWSVTCAPAKFNSNDRGTEIKSRVREGWDD